MTIPFDFISQLSDQDLLARVQRAASRERHATAELVALLMELDARRLYLAQGCSSLFTYCTQLLHLSEHAAYLRIEAARAARRFPIILNRLAQSDVTLTAIGLLRRISRKRITSRCSMPCATRVSVRLSSSWRD